MQKIYDLIADEALAMYGIVPDSLTFLGISAKPIYRVKTNAGDYLLRLHHMRPGTVDRTGDRPVLIRSEMQWLEALRRDTDLTVQRPVRLPDGDWFVMIACEQMDRSVPCSLLQWVEGELPDQLPTQLQAEQLGERLARLHAHGREWKKPDGFDRPDFTVENMPHSLRNIRQLIDKDIVRAADVAVVEQTGDRARAIIAGLARTEETWGLVHGDLTDGNYVLHHNEIRVIDFEECEFGYYLHDIARTLMHIIPQIRPSVFTGYRRICALPDDYLSLTESFFVYSVIENFGFHAVNSDEDENSRKAIPGVAARHFRKYLNGQLFLFTD